MIIVALALLFFQIWMFGRVFINVLFWQQAAVLEDAGVLDSLRRSREMAHSRREFSVVAAPVVARRDPIVALVSSRHRAKHRSGVVHADRLLS